MGDIEPYGGSDTVPGNVRFLTGGPGSIRGYAPNRVGPLDSKGRPLGGNSLLLGSVELRFPIVASSVGSYSSTRAMSIATASAMISAICVLA